MVQVRKIGGSLVRDHAALARIACTIGGLIRKQQEKTVIVLSAFEGETDRLVRLCGDCQSGQQLRERDALIATGEYQSVALLTSLLQKKGISAVSSYMSDCSFITDSNFSNAAIVAFDVRSLEQRLSCAEVVVMGGFQGLDPLGNITTLGRGGSDLSAVTLAACLHTGCELYKNVDGLFTANPASYRHSRLIEWLSYDDLLELSALGAKVIQKKAVLYAKRFEVPLFIGSFDKQGTKIIPRLPAQEGFVGIVEKSGIRRMALRLTRNADRPDSANLNRFFARNGFITESVFEQQTINGAQFLTFLLERRSEEMPNMNYQSCPFNPSDIVVNDDLIRISIIARKTFTGDRVDRIVSLLSSKGIPLISRRSSKRSLHLYLEYEHRSQVVGMLHELLLPESIDITASK